MVANANPPSASFQFDRVWTVALVEGDPKIAFVGRESGAIEKYDAAKLDAAKPLLALHGHTASVTGIIAPSADEIHTVSVDGTMRTWNTAAEVEGKREGKVVQLGGAARCILVVGEAYYVGLSTGVVVKVEGGKVVAQLKGHADTIAALAASETSLFTASYDYTIRSWDLTTGAVQHIYSGHSNHVKAIFAVNGTQLIGLGRDDNLIVWNIPSQDASAAADAPPDAEVVGEADPPTPRGQAKSHGLHAEATPQVKPAGVLALPSSPHTAALVGNQLAIACVDGSIRGIGVKALLKSVADYHAELEASIKAATRKIEQNCSIKIKNAKRLGKRAIRELHAQLVAEATGEPAHPPAATAEGDEAAQEEGGGDDAPAVAIGPEREAKLAEFTSKTSAHVEKEVHAAQKEKKDHIAALAPLTQQRFTQTKEKFPASPFCYTFRGTRPDAVVCAAADGTTGVLTGCGTKVEIVPCRIGVQSL